MTEIVLESSKDEVDGETSANIPTTTHPPGPKLAAVDNSARAPGINRSRSIARGVGKRLAAERGWRPEVLRAFQPGPTDDEDREAVEEVLSIITAGRTRKAPVQCVAVTSIVTPHAAPLTVQRTLRTSFSA